MAAPPPTVILPGDDHYLGITGLVTVVMQLAFFAVAYGCQFDLVTDFAGSTNFVAIALLTFFAGQAPAWTTPGAPGANPRAAVITALVCATRLELAGFLLYRVLRRGKDERFDAIRGSFASFLAFWVFQMLWAWGVTLPATFVNADPARTAPAFGTASDGIGVALWALGFGIQVVADAQKYRFRGDARNKGRWCDAGLWRWSRHPNFFGEICLWWGILALGSAQFDASAAGAKAGIAGCATWGYACLISPLLTMAILLLGSGIPTAEGNNQHRFMRTPAQAEAFAAYRARTSPLIPLPPALYAALPLAVKRWLLFEWPLYEAGPLPLLGQEHGPPAALAGAGAKAAAGAAAAEESDGRSR